MDAHICSFVRSFIRGGIRPLADFQRAFSLPPALRPMRPRLVVKPSLGLAQCTSPLTLGLVLYIYRAQLGRRVSLAAVPAREFNLIACRNLTRHAVGAGDEPTPCRTSQPGRLTALQLREP